MVNYELFLSLAIILVSTKVFGLFSRRLHLPQVVGALIAGIIVGPNVLNLVDQSNFLIEASEIGVLLIMFMGGLETDLSQLKKIGLPSLIIAIFGVLLPLIGGYFVYEFFFINSIVDQQQLFLESLFIGLILTATSVSITVETLREMGKLKGKIGSTILGAAIIDDIIGVVMLTIIMGLKDSSVSVTGVLLNIVLFFIVMLVIGYLFYKFFDYIDHRYGKKRRIPIYSIALCFGMAYVAEHFFGIADITGAYIAGIILCNIRDTEYINSKINVLSYMFFTPIFFSSIGIKMDLSGFKIELIGFVTVLTFIAIITKIIGCGFGAKLFGYSNRESLQVGLGMVSRGEVALIMARKGLVIGAVSAMMLPSIVVVIVVTTLVSPVLLRFAFDD